MNNPRYANEQNTAIKFDYTAEDGRNTTLICTNNDELFTRALDGEFSAVAAYVAPDSLEYKYIPTLLELSERVEQRAQSLERDFLIEHNEHTFRVTERFFRNIADLNGAIGSGIPPTKSITSMNTLGEVVVLSVADVQSIGQTIGDWLTDVNNAVNNHMQALGTHVEGNDYDIEQWWPK